ncbi:MAG: DNA methylase, partial [Aquificaceae bacterium]
FEENLKKAFKEIHRVLKPNGIAIIVYTHKSTEGWETLINALLDVGLVITASWPIDTEMRSRLRAQNSAALASSIYIVCRKMVKEEKGMFKDVKEEIRKHIHKRLKDLWREGVSGADFFIAGIGSAIEVFGKYEKVIDHQGNIIRADRFLEYVREVITDYAIRWLLRDGVVGGLSSLTRFYILYRWAYGSSKVHFDEARKLAQSVGIDIAREWDKGFIVKDREYIKVLGPQDRDLKELEDSNELIDVLHRVIHLWRQDKREEMKRVLIKTGYGK